MRTFSPFRKSLAHGAVVLLSGAAATLQAQRPGDSTARSIEPVRVSGVRGASIVGGTAAIVLRPDSLPIPTMPAPTLDLVLRQSAFVLVRQNSRGEMELSVRGSDSRQASVLVDGLPLTLGWDHRMDPSLFPTTGIDRVSIVRGLNTLLAGPNSLGGVINLDLNAPITGAGTVRPAALTLGSGLDQFGARALTVTGMAPMVLGHGTLRIRGGASYRRRNGFALSGGSVGDGITGGAIDPGDLRDADLRTNTELRQVDGFAALRYDRSGGAYVGLTVAANDAARGVAPEQHIRSPRFWRYPQQGRQVGILSAGSGLQRTPFGSGMVEASLGTNRNNLEIESYTNRTYRSIASRELGDESSDIARLQLTHSLPLTSILRVGGTFSRVRYDETLDAQLATARAVRYEQRLSSIGAEVEVPIASRIAISGGVVQDEARTPETGGRSSLGTLQRTGWRAGSTAMVSDAVRLHASVSRRARFASLRELYSGALNRFDPNPLLKPESLLGVEGGVTLSGGALERHGLQFQAVGFRNVLDDAVIRITLPDRRFRRINRDAIRSHGLETMVSWAPPSLRGLTVTGDATVQRIRVYDRTITTGASNERRPEHNPEVRGSFAITAPIWAGVTASAMARHTGTQFCQHPDLARLVRLSPQTIADAALSRSFPVRQGGGGLLTRMITSLAVDNIGNRTVYDQCGLPQPGRMVRLAFELR